jgi:hypothetical protein
MKNDQFIWIIDDNLSHSFINPDHIVRSEIDDNGNVVLNLSNSDPITIAGKGRGVFLKLLMAHSVLPNGEKPPEETVRLLSEKIDDILKP